MISQFCILADAQKGNACVLLIQQVISHKKIFAFGELLEVNSIALLKDSPEYQNAYNTLELFAYGTYNDYKNSREKFLDLNECQLLKLKQLTVVSLCASLKVVPYNMLRSELDIASVRGIEDLIVEAMYNDLVLGQFNQKEEVFVVKRSEGLNGVFGRDVRPEDTAALIVKLQAWRKKSAALCDIYEANARALRSSRQLRSDEELALQSSISHMKDHVKSLLMSHMGGGGVCMGMGDDLDLGDAKRSISGYGQPKSMCRFKRSRGTGDV